MVAIGLGIAGIRFADCARHLTLVAIVMRTLEAKQLAYLNLKRSLNNFDQ
jgi:hypothetical protein